MTYAMCIPAGHAAKAARRLTLSTAIAGVAVLLAACSGQSTTSPSTVTVTQPQRSIYAEATTTVAPPSDVTIPEVSGRNAEIVRKKLEQLGLTDVNLSSANPKYSVVVLASNWTVVSIEPPPGTVVQSSDAVVVKVYKD
jgi:PASTA domain-containing protein